MKKCTMCETEKEYDEFYYDSATDRQTSMCKPCMSRYNATRQRYKRMGRVFNRSTFKREKGYL
jgi:hypothetical protein